MPLHEETLNLAAFFAIGSGLNWVWGDRSVLGRHLVLRSGIAWRITRWTGLALFIVGNLAYQFLAEAETAKGSLAWLALIGTFLMSIGTARKPVPSPTPALGSEPD